MDTITFDNLPEAISRLHRRLNEIEQLIIQQSTPEQDAWFNLEELCAYLPDKPTKATVYTWVRERHIPYHKHGKRLAFLKSDIDNWIKEGREKTRSEIKAEAPTYLKKTG
jgi:excisionase family DNA binding protein